MRYFKLSDFDCQETGENKMNEDFLIKLDDLRHACGFPFIVTSGYRSPQHSIEMRKVKAGAHSKGIASDIRIHSGSEGFVIVSKAIKAGFRGIGVAKTFIHLDTRKTMPVIWSY